MDDLFKNQYRISTTRLRYWDYSQNGYYFVTVCVKARLCSFGRVEEDKMILSDVGKMVERCWQEIPQHFPFVKLDEFVVMPNHVHGVIIIAKPDAVETHDDASLPQAPDKPNVKTCDASLPNKFGPQSKNLASVIRGFKIGVKKWTTMNGIDFEWQSRFCDRVIRNEKELLNVRNYIRYNPLKWNEDEENPGRDA